MTIVISDSGTFPTVTLADQTKADEYMNDFVTGEVGTTYE